MTDLRIIVGDCREALVELGPGTVQTCITSPPYFGLRDYGHDGQIGAEPTPEMFVDALVETFREVRRVLRDDGTLWLNLGDSYAGWAAGLKPKDLLGIPWMVAFALRDDGWFLRSEIIWHKPNPMPESVTDRPTKAHEQVFLLSKSARYFYDADAIREDNAYEDRRGDVRIGYNGRGSDASRNDGDAQYFGQKDSGRNKRSVWTVTTKPYSGAHFATFPPALVEPCVLAGSREGDTVLDPFNGAGTTGLVALRNGRSYVGIELNPEYAAMTRKRLAGVTTPLPGLAA